MARKTNRELITNKIIVSLVIAGIFLISVFWAYSIGQMNTATKHSDNEMSIIQKVNALKLNLKSQGKYHCCLSGESCTYCLMKHGECDCLYDMMNGEEICGECLGEWIEGEGHACPMMRYGFQEAYPEIWETIKDEYIGKPLGPCPMMGG